MSGSRSAAATAASAASRMTVRIVPSTGSLYGALDRSSDRRGRLAGDRLGLGEGSLHRRQHVRAGIAVGHGEHVEGVDLVDVGVEVGDRRPERLEKAGSVAGSAGHAAPPMR